MATFSAYSPNNGSLPDGWEYKTLSEIVGTEGVFIDGDWVESKDQDPGGEVRLIQLADVGDGYYRNRSNRFLTHQKAAELGCTFLQKGDLLIARMPDPLGRACIFPGDPKQAVTVVDVCVVRTEHLDHRWLMYVINAPQFRKGVDSLQSGSTRKRISRKNLAKLKLPIPALPEQERIVSRIEELFSDLDAAVAGLERVRAGLKRYRASVLKAAVEGRLLIEGSEISEGELPGAWRRAKMRDIAEVRLGRQRSPSRAHGPNMRKYMRAANVTWHGIDLTDVKEMDFSPKEQETYRLKYGDILLSEASGSVSEVGKPAVWKNQLPESYIQNTLIRIRLHSDSPEYLYYHFLYDAIAERFRKIAKGVGIHHLGAENLSNWVVSLPPLHEQQQIVLEVERRLSVTQQTEAAVAAALLRATRLRQAVLKAAFEGRL